MREYSGTRRRLYARMEQLLAEIQSPDASRDGPCWEWDGTRNRDGYGIGAARPWTSSRLISRQVWSYLHGEIQGRHCVMHRCDNPPCYRPSHLTLGSKATNSADMVMKGRSPRTRNEASGRAKLTDAQVGEIRAWRQIGKTCLWIADAYGVHPAHVSRICRGLRRPAEHPAEAIERGWSLPRVGVA